MLSTRFRAVVALLTLATAACESSTEPEPQEFDAAKALADYQAVESVLTSGGWLGFQALGARGSFDLLGKSVAGSSGGPAAAPIISDASRGTTFAYDPALGEYAPDPSRSDAPETGVRFILYEEDVDGNPDPSREIGYADLIDEGDSSAEDIVLRFVCVQHGVTILDYRTSVDRLDGAGVVTVDGFLQGEGERLDFDIDVAGSEGESEGEGMVDIQFAIGMDSRDFEINGDVRGTEGESGDGEIDVSVRHGSESLRVDVEGTGTTLDGTFYLNGRVFANASGHPDNPVFTSASGDELSTLEVGVLIQMIGVVEEVFGLFEGLVEPVGGLVALGVVL